MRTSIFAAVFGFLAATSVHAETPEAVTSLTLDYLLTGASGLTIVNGRVEAVHAPVPSSCTDTACQFDYINPFNNLVFDLSFGTTLGGNEIGTVRADFSGSPDFDTGVFSVPSLLVGSDPAYLRFDLVGGSIDPIDDLKITLFDADDRARPSVSFNDLVEGAQVPLPASAWLLLGGLAAVFARRSRTAQA